MESSWWPALILACGLALPGALAPVTFFVKPFLLSACQALSPLRASTGLRSTINVSEDNSEEFASQTPIPHHIDLRLKPPPMTIPFNTIRHSLVKMPARSKIPPGSKFELEPRVYPGYTYSEDFGSYPTESDHQLTPDFAGEMGEFPASNIFPTRGDALSRPDKSNEDYAGPTAYAPNMESGEPPDYQSYYGSDEENDGEEESPGLIEDHEEHSSDDDDDEASGPVNYEVEEKIPDDLKYKPPKVKVFPLPPPCLGATPPPYPTNPPPPKPGKPKPKTKPKPGYYRYAGHKRPLQRPNNFKFRSPTSRYSSQPIQRMKYSYSPYVVRQINLPSGPIIVRTRTIPSVRLTSRPVTSHQSKKTTYQKQTTGGDNGNSKEVVKEVHIHHHHDPPLIHPATIPAIIPLYPLYDENGYPVNRADQYLQGRSLNKQSTGLTSSGSEFVARFHGGQFAEPPPYKFAKVTSKNEILATRNSSAGSNILQNTTHNKS